MNGMWWRELNDEEVEQFKEWARENFDPAQEVDALWHPVVREEWARLAAIDEAASGRIFKNSAVI